MPATWFPARAARPVIHTSSSGLPLRRFQPGGRRDPNGPALTSGDLRCVTVTGSCGIPATARAVAVNVTVVQHPGDVASEISTTGFQADQSRGNNAILPLAFDGTGTLSLTPSMAGGGTVHLILDVGGWF